MTKIPQSAINRVQALRDLNIHSIGLNDFEAHLMRVLGLHEKGMSSPLLGEALRFEKRGEEWVASQTSAGIDVRVKVDDPENIMRLEAKLHLPVQQASDFRHVRFTKHHPSPNDRVLTCRFRTKDNRTSSERLHQTRGPLKDSPWKAVVHEERRKPLSRRTILRRRSLEEGPDDVLWGNKVDRCVDAVFQWKERRLFGLHSNRVVGDGWNYPEEWKGEFRHYQPYMIKAFFEKYCGQPKVLEKRAFHDGMELLFVSGPWDSNLREATLYFLKEGKTYEKHSAVFRKDGKMRHWSLEANFKDALLFRSYDGGPLQLSVDHSFGEGGHVASQVVRITTEEGNYIYESQFDETGRLHTENQEKPSLAILLNDEPINYWHHHGMLLTQWDQDQWSHFLNIDPALQELVDSVGFLGVKKKPSVWKGALLHEVLRTVVSRYIPAGPVHSLVTLTAILTLHKLGESDMQALTTSSLETFFVDHMADLRAEVPRLVNAKVFEPFQAVALAESTSE